ncbi:hypothetical protein J6590_007246 [Homalodisca vitripennis]|nr:hypothetical protein J6590_007246 [Homalodisca vitripennis]
MRNIKIETLRAKLKETHEVAARRKALARAKYERQYNMKVKDSLYEEGQYVLLHVPSIGRHRVKKLSKLWKGPYRIVKVLSSLNLVLKVRNREIVVHVNRVKPYVSRTKVNQVPEVHVDDDVGDIEIPDSNICIGEGTPSADDGIPVPSVGTPRTGNRLPRVKRRPARLEDYVS